VVPRVGQSPRHRGTRRRRGPPAPPPPSPAYFNKHLGARLVSLIGVVHRTPHVGVATTYPSGSGLDRSRRGHTPALTAPSRTVPSRDRMRQPMAAQPHAGHREPGRNRFSFGGSGVAEGILRGLTYFNSRKHIFSSKNPSKSILTPKIVKPFPENS
jgi:hypothetical protein